MIRQNLSQLPWVKLKQLRKLILQKNSDSPEPLWYTQSLDRLEREERGEISDDDASFYDYWSYDDEQFAEEAAGETSETSDEEALLPTLPTTKYSSEDQTILSHTLCPPGRMLRSHKVNCPPHPSPHHYQ